MVVCFLSAVGEKGGRIGLFEDAIATYFLAKGIFCSAALFPGVIGIESLGPATYNPRA